MANPTISVLGTGWLGLPLAGHLLSIGYDVKGSFVSYNTKMELQRWGIQAFEADITEPHRIDEKFFRSETLIITVPPSKGGKDEYPANIQTVLERARVNAVRNVVFTSSTSVYPDSPGITTEDSAVQENSSRGNMMLAAENAVRKIYPETATILRLGGLMGPGRHPGRFLSGKANVPGAEVPVNFLSLEDGARIISEIVFNQKFGGTHNLVCPEHPTKREYYEYACGLMKIPPPQFDAAEIHSGYKLVDGSRLTATTGIEYLTTDWKIYLRSLQG